MPPPERAVKLIPDPWDLSPSPVLVLPEPAFPKIISIEEIIKGGRWNIWAGFDVGDLAVLSQERGHVAVQIGIGSLYRGILVSAIKTPDALVIRISCTEYSEWEIRLKALQRKS